MDNQNESKVKTKNITVGLVFSWVFSIFVGIGGFTLLFSKPLAGLLSLLAAAIVFPPLNKELKKKYNVSLSSGIKSVIVIIILIIGGMTIGNTSPQSTVVQNTNNSVQDGTASKTVQKAVATAPQVLLNISGSGTKTTKTFTVPGDWTLDWSYDCSNFGFQGNFQVFSYNADGTMSFQNAGVNQLGKSGSDTEYYHNGGTYYLVVNSECKWTMKVNG